MPWFIAGPAIGLLVVLLYALVNRRLGVSGAYRQVRFLVLGQPITETWRVWFFGGLIAGSLLAAILRGGPVFTLGYGNLAAVLPLALLAPTLLTAGVLIGFGSRWAEGCTSGHGLTGVASRSRGSLVSAMTFWLTALAVTLSLHALTGGVL